MGILPMLEHGLEARGTRCPVPPEKLAFPVPRRPHAPLAEVSAQFPNVRQHVFYNVASGESHRRGLHLEF
jgi:hypothetical protein